MTTPLVLGHRGAPLAAVENTLAAFRAAISLGAHGAEFDVRRSSDGTAVVCHDATLERFTGRATRVRSSSAWALSCEDLGGGEGVPTLDRVLEVLRGKVVNVEIKGDDDEDPRALAACVATVLRRFEGAHPSVVVSSFEPHVLAALCEIAPEIPRGMLLPTEPELLAAVLSQTNAVRPSAMHPHRSVTSEQIRAWRSSGYAVNVWTVDDADDARRLADAGASMIISNRPEAIIQALR